jgi:hypothetical protein
MHLLIDEQGRIHCLYGETIELTSLGELTIRRASHVEPEGQRWFADLSPVSGPRLGPFARRSQALEAEEEWLHRYWLESPNSPTTADSPP